MFIDCSSGLFVEELTDGFAHEICKCNFFDDFRSIDLDQQSLLGYGEVSELLLDKISLLPTSFSEGLVLLVTQSVTQSEEFRGRIENYIYRTIMFVRKLPVARMRVPKMVKNGFNSVLQTSAGSRRLVAARDS